MQTYLESCQEKMDNFAKFFPAPSGPKKVLMQHTFLIEIVQKIGFDRRGEVVAFLQSPYFNRDGNAREIIALYEVIVAAVPEFSDNLLDKEQIYQTLFPGKPFVPGKLDKLMTGLKKLLRLFVITQHVLDDENEAGQQLVWVAWLRKQNLKERYHLAFKKLKNRNAIESLEEYRINVDISREAYEWESAHNHWQGDLQIPQLLDQLARYYHAFKLDLHNRFLLQQKAVNLLHTLPVDRNEAELVAESPYLGALKRMNLLLQKETPSDVDFASFTEFLEQNKSRIPADVIRIYTAYLRNICAMLINAGHLAYYPILYKIYKNSLAEGNLIFMGKIDANAYLNIVGIALAAGEKDWAEAFTEEYRHLTHDTEPFFYHFNKARCLFAKRKFDEVLDYLTGGNAVESSSSYYQLMIRLLELKTFYELDSDLLPFKMDAFRKFIERTAPKAISKSINAMHLNFIYILNQLMQSPKKSPARAEKILQRIRDKQFLAERQWLMEKARELQ